MPLGKLRLDGTPTPRSWVARDDEAAGANRWGKSASRPCRSSPNRRREKHSTVSRVAVDGLVSLAAREGVVVES